MTWIETIIKFKTDFVCSNSGSILQIGFNKYVADSIQAHKPSSHTIIEINSQAYLCALEWSKNKPHVTVLFGDWFKLLVRDEIPKVDGVLFNISFDSRIEFINDLIEKCLNLGGKFTYWDDERYKGIDLILEFEDISFTEKDGQKKTYLMPKYTLRNKTLN
tara:strand:- start:4541 stop:5023 length:483 start_codon:yes stop_codon:yes gene_type:complete